METSKQIPNESAAPQGVLRSIPDAVKYSGLPERTIQHLIYTRRIPVVHIGRRVYLRQSDLDQLIENGTQK